MNIFEIEAGDILWHKHHRVPVHITLVHYSPEHEDKCYVECYRKPYEEKLMTHPSLLDPMPTNKRIIA